MNAFCPDGYLPTQEVILRAAEHWFPERFAALERAVAPPSETKPDNSLDALARALSQPPVPDELRYEFHDIANQTVHRLRNFLHQGKLEAYYFKDDGCHFVLPEFWATAHADGVMESGTYWPFGAPTRWYEQRPNYPLYLKQLALDALFNERPTDKPRLPRAKMTELVAALRKLDHLPNRKKQREALCKLQQFEQYHLTEDVLREAEKQLPRKSGRKRLPPNQ